MLQNNHNLPHRQQNSRNMIPFLHPTSIFAAAVSLCLLLCSCSGTGTMYTPVSEEASAFGTTSDAAADFQDGEETGTAIEGEHGNISSGESSPEEEEPRIRRAFLEGTGSDLYAADTVDYYYNFTLEGVSMSLPCSFAVFSRAGWELKLPDLQEDAGKDTVKESSADAQGPDPAGVNKDSGTGTKNSSGSSANREGKDTTLQGAGTAITEQSTSEAGAEQEILIPGWSYEFFDASPAGEGTEGSFFLGIGQSSPRKIRLCLANYTASPLAPAKCTVCGIQVTADSEVSIQTVFGAGIGNYLEDLTAVYGTDVSIWKQTKYRDGTVSVLYRFSNGLTEDERIPVLAEAEEKSMAEFFLAETAEDGKTINAISLYYFRLPN